METAVEFRWLERSELSRVSEVDRTERIEVLYDQHGTRLVARHGEWSAPAWDADGHGEHSVEAKGGRFSTTSTAAGLRSVRSLTDAWSA